MPWSFRAASALSTDSAICPGLGRRHRPLLEPRAQRLAVEQFHREEQLHAVLRDFIELADVRMAHAGGDSRLAPQALALLLVGSFSDPLDRDGPIQALVVRGVDDAHAALTELAADTVLPVQRVHRAFYVAGGSGTQRVPPA